MTRTAATRPTLWFIGVTTGASSIMRVFPRWAAYLGLDATIAGMDFAPGAPPESFRQAVGFLRGDPLSRGALVTTHKLDLFAACRDLFDETGPHATLMEEVSCLSKRDGRLLAEATDPVSAGLTLDAMLGDGHFDRTGAEMLVMGAGGSAIAMTWHLMAPGRGADRPSRIVVTDVAARRLAHIRAIHDRIGSDVPLDYRLVSGASGNDEALAGMAPGSLVVNATGLGKDRPGSPLTGAAPFPPDGIIWELNYRGDLVFLEQAGAQAADRGLTVSDGWTYFLHGWTQVIARVFDVTIPVSGPEFDALSRIAAQETGRSE